MSEKKGDSSPGGVILTIWGICFLLLVVVFSGINKTGQPMGMIIFYSLLLSFCIMLVIFFFFMALVSGKVRKVVKEEERKDEAAGISRYPTLVHVVGLDVPANCKASAILNPDDLIITCAGREFILHISKIRNVDFQVDIDETIYLQSHFIGGVLGAMAYGVEGAIVGAAPSTERKRDTIGYAIISYENAQGESKVFLLKDEVANSKICAKLVDVLKPKIVQQIERVEL